MNGLKGKHGGATVFQPLSTGITFAPHRRRFRLTRFPMITSGYGRSDSADGSIFKWNFLARHYWSQATRLLQHIAKKEGGWDKLKGKKIAVVYHDSPVRQGTAADPRRAFKMHGFILQLQPVPAPGVEQKAIWLQVRQQRPDFVIMQTWGVMTPRPSRKQLRPAIRARRCSAPGGSGANPI
jgi:branched-chain amino acid transport system substrate-binding protein